MTGRWYCTTSLAHSRTLVVTLHVSDPHVKVTDPKGNTVTSQVNPYWVTDDEISTRLYKVCSCVS